MAIGNTIHVIRAIPISEQWPPPGHLGGFQSWKVTGVLIDNSRACRHIRLQFQVLAPHHCFPLSSSPSSFLLFLAGPTTFDNVVLSSLVIIQLVPTMSSTRRTANPASMQGRRRNQPTRQSRTHVASYHEETTSDETTDQQGLEHSAVRQGTHSLRPSSTANTRPSYREQSTDDDDQSLSDQAQSRSLPTTSESRVESSTAAPPTRNPPRARASARAGAHRGAQTARRREAPSRPIPPSPKRLQKTPKRPVPPLKKTKTKSAAEGPTRRSDVIPPWQTLPYHILFDIFLRAFYPLDSPTAQATKIPGKAQETKLASNLLGIALLCRAFAEPALAALYYSPPVFSAHDGLGLLDLLSTPQQQLSINYAGKIKELCIDAETVLTLTSGPTRGYFDIKQLLHKVPQLHTLRLYHPEDSTFGLPVPTLSLGKWRYRPSFFTTILTSEILLRGWEWNGRFCELEDFMSLIVAMHCEKQFKSIKNLRLVHITDGFERDSGREDDLSLALRLLPEIECLEFHECPIMSGDILLKLPLTLRSLTLSNCGMLLASHVINLFKVHGGQLRELILNHNRHMNMEFMPYLGILCPNLERFRVDFSMFDGSSYHDLDPHFDQLLFISQKPSWPESIEEIELYQLRHWGGEVAEMFFESLVVAAPNLKHLRRLDISAILSGPWRDRAQFRDKWFRRLEKVFLRHSPPPDPNLRSLRKRSLASPVAQRENGGSAHPTSQEAPSKRQSSRIAQRHISESMNTEQENLSDSDTGRIDPKNVQGMCEHISVRIDNQRPADHQFNECDFLDDELSGDEDWDEDYDGLEFEDGHAW